MKMNRGKNGQIGAMQTKCKVNCNWRIKSLTDRQTDRKRDQALSIHKEYKQKPNDAFSRHTLFHRAGMLCFAFNHIFEKFFHLEIFKQ